MPEILYADAAVVVCVKPVGALSEGDGENAMPALLRAALRPISGVYRLHPNGYLEEAAL